MFLLYNSWKRKKSWHIYTDYYCISSCHLIHTYYIKIENGLKWFKWPPSSHKSCIFLDWSINPGTKKYQLVAMSLFRTRFQFLFTHSGTQLTFYYHSLWKDLLMVVKTSGSSIFGYKLMAINVPSDIAISDLVVYWDTLMLKAQWQLWDILQGANSVGVKFTRKILAWYD